MFSIITPVLNGMPYLPLAVHSIANEKSSASIQHIIMDGGSTDGSLEWLEENQDLGYELYTAPDAGQSDALIKGFKKAHGDLLGWLNADDIMEPGALQKVAEAFVAHKDCSAVSGAALIIDENGHIIGATKHLPDGDLKSLLKHLQNIPQPSTFFRRDLYETIPGISLTLRYAMDVDLWLQLAKLGPIHVMKEEIFSRFRIHQQAKTVTNQDATAREDLMVRIRHGMRWAPKTTFHLSKRAFVYPMLRPIQRVAKRALALSPLHDRGRS